MPEALRGSCQRNRAYPRAGDYTKTEALRLIDAVVTAYIEAMVQEHEQSKYPPVRMQLDASLAPRPSG